MLTKMSTMQFHTDFFKDFANFDSLYSNQEKRTNFFSQIEPLLKEEDLNLATWLGDKHLAIVLWIERNRYKTKKKMKNKILNNILFKDFSPYLDILETHNVPSQVSQINNTKYHHQKTHNNSVLNTSLNMVEQHVNHITETKIIHVEGPTPKNTAPTHDTKISHAPIQTINNAEQSVTSTNKARKKN